MGFAQGSLFRPHGSVVSTAISQIEKRFASNRLQARSALRSPKDFGLISRLRHTQRRRRKQLNLNGFQWNAPIRSAAIDY